jgi:hypothetical protein
MEENQESQNQLIENQKSAEDQVREVLANLESVGKPIIEQMRELLVLHYSNRSWFVGARVKNNQDKSKEYIIFYIDDELGRVKEIIPDNLRGIKVVTKKAFRAKANSSI